MAVGGGDEDVGVDVRFLSIVLNSSFPMSWTENEAGEDSSECVSLTRRTTVSVIFRLFEPCHRNV